MQIVSKVVFDLDGTLLDWDSTTVWIFEQLKKAWWRMALALVVAPIAGPLIAYPPLRRRGASAFFWVASVGLCEQALKQSIEAYADAVSRGDFRLLKWRREALVVLQAHLDEGARVAVATASPTWIAAALLSRIDGRIEVAGSRLRRVFGGWVFAWHCRHEQKCEALAEMAFGERWDVAYSDSADDIPLLRGAASVYAINASSRTRRKLLKSGLNIEFLLW